MRRDILAVLLGVVLSSAVAFAQTDTQTANPVGEQTEHHGIVPVFKVTVIGSTVPAINYRNRESTDIGFEGTSLLARARGKATVQNKQGTTRIHAEFRDLQPPAAKFGLPYLAYVLWAITPEGRPLNLGELMVNDDGNAKIDAATNLQAFGLVVTAEPYFAVTRPSDMVVVENRVLPSTTGTIMQVNAKYELLKRGSYTTAVSASAVTPFEMDPRTPIDVYEAENAVRIAKWAGADEQAADTLRKAELDLTNAQGFQARKGNKKTVITLARSAVQTAEDARIIALNKYAQQERAQIQKNAEEAQTRAERAQERAEEARARAAAEAQAKAEAQQAQLQAEQQAQQAHRAAEQAQQQAEEASQRAADAEQRAEAMRARLLRQLNTVLQTQDTAQGLLVRMSDVLFSSGSYQLKPDAKLALAKLSGVLLAYPGLKLQVNGYTDNTGSSAFNDRLSEQRAEGVRTFLIEQRVPADAVTAQGFGESDPIASNATASGRELNRRVDMIVSGSLIGTRVASAAASSEPH